MRKYTEEKLKEAVSNCNTWADVCRWFGVKPATGGQSHLKRVATQFKIDTSHFTGQGWSRGKQVAIRQPIEKYLVENSTVKSDWLKKRLVREGIKEHRCERCSRVEWEGYPIPIELHHINSVHNDNRIGNLQILCPNCHALQFKHS